jgi:hypothetical protein
MVQGRSIVSAPVVEHITSHHMVDLADEQKHSNSVIDWISISII